MNEGLILGRGLSQVKPSTAKPGKDLSELVICKAPRIAGFDFIALIDNMAHRTGYSHEHCRRICADLSNTDLERLNELVKNPSRNGEIDDLIGCRAFSI